MQEINDMEEILCSGLSDKKITNENILEFLEKPFNICGFNNSREVLTIESSKDNDH